MENLLAEYPNLQNEGSEGNIYNYIVKNVPIIIENTMVEGLSQDRASCRMDIDQNSGVTQCEKFSNENVRIPIDTTCEEGEIPLAELQSHSLETKITTEILTVGNIEQPIEIAPGEGKNLYQFLMIFIEMTHSHLFPIGKFGYKVKRDVPLTPSKHFNQQLLNYSQHFASEPFYVHSVMQNIQLNDQISITLRKITSNSVNTKMLSNNFKTTVQQFISQDKAYSFMSSIKGTPAYWEKILIEVLAMIKQLGTPTFF